MWNYDHFYGLVENTKPTHEGWTTLAAMAVVTRQARIGCMVTGVTYRNPAILVKMAVTVDHISGGRLDFGIGAGWHEAEHRGYGIDFPGPGTRVAMLDEALTVIRRLWTEESVSFEGRFYTLQDAICEPKPLQRPHPPIVVRRVTTQDVARHRPPRRRVEHAQPSRAPGVGEASSRLTEACAEVGRDPAAVTRSVQLFLHPREPEQVDGQLDLLAQYEDLGCQHAVLSFYQPPSVELLQRCAALR